MVRLSLSKTLKAGQTAVGTWITLPTPAVTEIACQAGLSWVAIDLEHTTLGDHHFEEHARVACAYGVPCLARIPSVDPGRIKRLLDAGAEGIILTNVTSREQLDDAWSAMCYPPVGQRGVGLGRAHRYGPGFGDYAKAHTDLVLVAQIEHKNALPKLREILDHPELDAWMIGPYDLTASLGVPGQFQHPEYSAALQVIETAARSHSAAFGLHIVEPDTATLREKIQEGYRFIAYTVDFRALEVAFTAGVVSAQPNTTAALSHGSGESPQ